MNSLNPLAPAKKYRISYKGKVWYANVIDFNSSSGVLTADGVVRMIYQPDQLTIQRMDELIH